MVNLAHILSNRIVAVALRAALGGYLIYMGREFYRDPLASFRKAARPLPYDPWVRHVIRGLACFCLWGGCFIIAAAIAVQILDLHGYVLAIELMAIATMAAWLLLPKLPDASAEDGSEIESTRRPK
jgi:threonine/homoserine/homoserine lactone efflux protein